MRMYINVCIYKDIYTCIFIYIWIYAFLYINSYTNIHMYRGGGDLEGATEVQIALQMYKTISITKRPTSTWLFRGTNEPVKSESRYIAYFILLLGVTLLGMLIF
jgi:hypothetical protein